MGRIIKKIAKDTNMQEDDVKAVLSSLAENIASDINSGKQKCLVTGLGSFYSKPNKPHNIKSIHTGQQTMTKETYSIKFSPSANLKEKITL